jgi:hypothetical protein
MPAFFQSSLKDSSRPIAGTFLLCVVMIFVFSGAALAQRDDQCITVPEMIAKLRPSTIGAYNLWDTVYGEMDESEKFVSAIQNEEGDKIVATGERAAYKGGAKTALLVEIDRRGRPVWDKPYKIDGLQSVKKIIKISSGYAVLGTIKNGEVPSQGWIGMFDETGNHKRDVIIQPESIGIEAMDIILNRAGNEMIVVGSALRLNARAQPYTMMFWVDLDGKILQQRSFTFGIENRTNAISWQEDRFYITSGFIRSDDGRKAGWMMRLNEEGGIVWQREYARGMSAQLLDVANYGEKYVIGVGQTMPSGTGRPAAWVMMIDAFSSEIAWQRYYQDDYDFHAFEVQPLKDGPIAIAINGDHGKKPEEELEEKEQKPLKKSSAKKKDEEEKLSDYLRLLILDPRGIILQSRSYFNAGGVQGFGMVLGKKGEPVVLGHTDVMYRIENPTPQKGDPTFEEKMSREAWALAAAPNDPYQDPCIQPYRFIP